MDNVHCAFTEVVAWLRTRADRLSSGGANVEVHVHPVSVRLRVEMKGRLGELTVWESGVVHLAVVDLGAGDFVFEEDGKLLSGAPLEVTFKGFFDQLSSS